VVLSFRFHLQLVPHFPCSKASHGGACSKAKRRSAAALWQAQTRE
jgi:hypothetical protein